LGASDGSPRIILASASPRRRDLLRAAGIEFEVEVSNAGEELEPDWSPEQAAEALARRKALAVAERHRGEAVLVLGADTLVALGEAGELLGKPADEAQARRMLSALAGSRHRVLTGVAVVNCARLTDQETPPGAPDPCRSAFERTWVTMRVLSTEEIEAYVATLEWRDKAGGYAIQESADAFVTALEEGGFDNVVGLPVALSLDLLGCP
jgi:septum formation protein